MSTGKRRISCSKVELKNTDWDNNDDNNDNNDNNMCPVCFCPPSSDLKFTVGPCNHPICQPCAERILLSTTPGRNSVTPGTEEEEDDEAYVLRIPTMGQCPICRSELSLFHLRKYNDDHDDHDTTTTTIDDNNVGNNSNDNRSLTYPKDVNVSNWPIRGLTFAAQDHPDGGTFYFPSAAEDEVGEQKRPSWNRPMLFDVSHDIVRRRRNERRKEKQYFFNPGCHFHHQSRTFHGIVDDFPFQRLTVILQFSADFRFIQRGVCIPSPLQGGWSTEDFRKRWPLDGQWTVEWGGSPGLIQVKDGGFQYIQLYFQLDLTNPKNCCFVWPATKMRQEAVGGLNLVERPFGPALGDKIHWMTDNKFDIEWTRETVRENFLTPMERYGPLDIVYRSVGEGTTTDRVPSTYVEETLWGNAFCQGRTMGLSSYHFLSPTESYISYEHLQCTLWPQLDNDSPIPSRVFFRNVRWDETERVFRGDILWSEEHGSTWQDCRKWIYTMKFDSEYTCILSGSVESIMFDSSNEEGGEELQFLSNFGTSLLYINAAIIGGKLDNNARRIMREANAFAYETENLIELTGLGALFRMLLFFRPLIEWTGLDALFRMLFFWHSGSSSIYSTCSLRSRLEQEGASFQTMELFQTVLIMASTGSKAIDFNHY